MPIQSFGLGLTHKPDTLIELSSRSKGVYTYVRDWMMLRESLAGCLGALQTTSHKDLRLKLNVPEGSPARFAKFSGALHTTRRGTGREAEVSLGDLRFGEKRDVLIQLVIQPDGSAQDTVAQDPWEKLVSGLEALGGEADEQRVASVEEVPLLQADLTYEDLLRDGQTTHAPQPSLFAITMLPQNPEAKNSSIISSASSNSPIPPNPSIIQRRMELLTSDMLTRAMTLVSRGQHDRAQPLLTETRNVLKGLGKGSLPPLPPNASWKPTPTPTPAPTGSSSGSPNGNSNHLTTAQSPSTSPVNDPDSNSNSNSHSFNGCYSYTAAAAATIPPASAVDAHIMASLDADLVTAMEWILHPAIFVRDSRKAVLQAIGVISSQRAYTFRTPSEANCAQRVLGIRQLTERSKEWREFGNPNDALTEE